MSYPSRFLTLIVFNLTLLFSPTVLVSAASPSLTTITGTYYQIIADNFDRGLATTSHVLITTAGHTYTLEPSPQITSLQSGTTVTLNTPSLDQPLLTPLTVTVAPHDDKDSLEPLGVTQKKLAIILVNFPNNLNQPYSTTDIITETYLSPYSIRAYFAETSHNIMNHLGALQPEGDVFGWFTLPTTATSCDNTTAFNWVNLAKTAAAASGYLETNYTSTIVVFPHLDICNWVGMALIGGPIVWINEAYDTSVVAHELGHNYYLHHAAAYYNCTNSQGQRVPYSDNCLIREYGDPFDIMGASLNHFSAYHKIRLDYSPPTASQTVTTSGSYDLYPQELDSGQINSLRLPTPDLIDNNFYYLEYRRPYGTFDNFTSTHPVVNGISIRIGSDYTTLARTYLLDTNPLTTSFSDAPLALGKTFTDPAGLSLTATAVTPEKATISVNFPFKSYDYDTDRDLDILDLTHFLSSFSHIFNFNTLIRSWGSY